MKVWICNGCRAEITEEHPPKACPLCGQNNRGFDEGEKDDQNPEDKKYSEKYEEVLEDLEKYNEGTDPEKLKYSFEE